MLEPSLLHYIRNTLAQGFAAEQIRQELLRAGWQESDINSAFASARKQDQNVSIENGKPIEVAQKTTAEPSPQYEKSFFSTHRKLLIVVLIVLVTLPIIAYGGFLLYQKIAVKTTSEPATDRQTNPAGRPNDGIDMAKPRDLQRIKDIAAIQAALDDFFKINNYYPKALTDLKEYEKGPPADPETKHSYLYAALGEPAIHYSLTFILEERLGTLKAGLQIVSSEQRLPAELLQNQESVIQGETSRTINDGIIITDLGQTPFYPGEEARMQVTGASGEALKSVFLVMSPYGESSEKTGFLELVDTALPFEFSFSSPKIPGVYTIQIFAFDEAGQGYLQKTALRVDK